MFEKDGGSSINWAQDESDLYKILRKVRTEKESFKLTLRGILTESEKRERLFEENLEMFFNNIQDIAIVKACGDRYDNVLALKYKAFNVDRPTQFKLQENLTEAEFEVYQRLLDLLVIFVENEQHKNKTKTFDELQDSFSAIFRLVDSLQNIGVGVEQIRFEL